VSFWTRTLQTLGLRKDDNCISVSGDHVVFRDVRRAKTLPQEPAQAGPRHMGICDHCRSPVRQVVFTTAGDGAQAAIWQAYPLAADGWLCPACGWWGAPRFITPEEVTEYGRRAVEHAANGQFDDAEFWLRRILGSWPGYHAAYADLGQLMAVRANATSDLQERERHGREAMRWCERAIEADPDWSIPGVRVRCARILAARGEEERATELLKLVLSRNELPHDVRSEASALLADIQEGMSLFTRATEILGDVVFESPSDPLSPAERTAMERGRALLVQAAKRKATFRTLFFLGKSELRLRNWEAARATLEEALKIDPDQADGCRELAWAYLELERAAEALPLAGRAVQLRPDDPTLQCNLALVLLLTGDIRAARTAADAAIVLDPRDPITKHLLRVIDDVATGQRNCPRSLGELEGGREH